jgi:hypothetical protein
VSMKMAVFSFISSAPSSGDRPDDGGSKYLWNVGKLLPDYTALLPRRQPSSWKNINLNTWRLYAARDHVMQDTFFIVFYLSSFLSSVPSVSVLFTVKVLESQTNKLINIEIVRKWKYRDVLVNVFTISI